MNNRIKIKVVGSNINRFIMKLNSKKINIYNIDKKNNDIAYLIIDYKYFDSVIKYKTYYDVSIVDYIGPVKIKNNLLKNKYTIIIFILAIFLVFFLSNITFSINVISNDKETIKLLKDELRKNGIYKYSFLKDYKHLNTIKKKILNKYSKKFEWLEIERVGTGYIVRFEKRIENNKKKDERIYDLVATKDAYIIDLDIEQGNILKNINEYVKKGDIIVSSDIMLNDEVKGSISVKGDVYGEVWYKVDITLPNDYLKKELSGNSVNTYSLKMFSHKIVFNKTRFNDKIIISVPIINNSLFPISFNKEIIKEVIIDKKISRTDLATSLCLDKIKEKLKGKEEIINYLIVDKKQNKDNLDLSLFVTVKEKIGELVAR